MCVCVCVCVLGGSLEVRADRTGSSHVVCSWGCRVLPKLVLRGAVVITEQVLW